jgi:Uma2 family endonuclease
MITTHQLKETIIEQLKTQEIVRIPASEGDFFTLANELPFKIEYHDSEIITMGLSTPWHEMLIMTLGGILYNLFYDQGGFSVLGSNTEVQIPKFEGGYYLPDIVVVKGEIELKEESNCIITNPYIVIEILSKSTANYDRGEKLPEYKRLESLQQIIFINQDKLEVESYERTDKPNTWLNQTLTNSEESLLIHEKPIALKEIYRNIQFAR